MNSLLKEVRDIEFNRIKYNEESEDYFEIMEGTIPILLSAPHGAKHLRNGEWKEEDEYTSSMAIKLGELTGAHVIFLKNKTREDSNSLARTKYKDAIKKLVEEEGIKFVADIHGAKKERKYKIDVGIIDERNMDRCSCPSLKRLVEESLREFQHPLFNLCFSAGGQETVTLFVKRDCGIEAAQFEINAKYRIVDRKPDSLRALSGEEPEFKARAEDVLELLDHLRKMILNINRELTG